MSSVHSKRIYAVIPKFVHSSRVGKLKKGPDSIRPS